MSVWVSLIKPISALISLLASRRARREARALTADEAIERLRMAGRAETVPSMGTQLSDNELLDVPWERRGNTGWEPGEGSLASQLSRIPRMVMVTGEGGAGKSSVASQLAKMQTQDDRTAIVVLHLSSWAASMDLIKWIVNETIERHGRSGHRVATAAILRELIVTRRLRVAFDGFDEIDPTAARALLTRIYEEDITGWIVFSRPAGAGLLDEQHHIDADIVRLLPVRSAMAAEHLRTAIKGTCPEWETVATALCTQSIPAVNDVLCVPLFLTIGCNLARSNVTPPDPATYADDALLREWLLSSYVEHALTGPGSKQSTAHQARRWLQQVAAVQEAIGREDLAWWDLARTVPRLFAILGGVLLTILMLVPLELTVRLLTSLSMDPGKFSMGSSPAVAGAFVTGGVIAATSGLRMDEDTQKIEDFIWTLAATTVLAAFMVMPTTSAASPLSLRGWLASFVACAMIGLSVGGTAFTLAWLLLGPTADDWRRRFWQRVGLRRDQEPRPVPRLLGINRTGGVLGFLARVLLSACFGLATSLFGVALRESGASTPSIGNYCLASAISGLLLFSTLQLGSSPAIEQEQPRQRMLASNGLGIALTSTLWVASFLSWIFGSMWLANGPTMQVGWPTHSSDFGVRILWVLSWLQLLAVPAAVGLALSSAGRYLVGATYLWILRRSPAPTRFFGFLNWAQSRGILRQTGLAYTFWHPAVRRSLCRELGEPGVSHRSDDDQSTDEHLDSAPPCDILRKVDL